MSSEKPTLPSIQLMLEGAGIQPGLPFVAERKSKSSAYHRRHASSDVVGHMENLTIGSPTPMEPNASTNNLTATSASSTGAPSHTSNNPNWPAPFRPTPLYQHPYHHHRSARNLHSRSYSDYTHPYVTSPPVPSSHHGLLAPPSQHRRTVSTSTLDSMIHRGTLDTYSTTTPPVLYPSHSSSTLSQSPTLSIKTPSSVDEQHQHPAHHLFDTDEEEEGYDDHSNPVTKTGSTTSTTDNSNTGNNKYQCPYCQKGFSRPSSLRIHTYSHTGEKPFTCPEPNCDRAFSVQSNMRRHIRVHKLNGKHLKMRRSPPPIKPLAAKPSWMQDRPLTQESGLPLPLN